MTILASEPRTRRALLTSALVFVVFSLPLWRLAYSGTTLTGQYEESLGYRYFYSLRPLYDPDPYVFIPQGHLMDLANRGIQAALSAMGHAPTELFPRIDLFGFLTLQLAYILSCIGLFLIVRNARNAYEATLVSLIVFLPYTDYRIWGFNVLFQPDYPNWIAAFALICAWIAIDLMQARQRIQFGGWDFIALAGLTAAALGIKVTLVVYPVALACVFVILREGFLKSLILAILSGVAGLLTWLGMLLLYFNLHPTLLNRFIKDERLFGSSVRPNSAYIAWLSDSLSKADWLLSAVLLLPVGVACLLIVPRLRSKWPLVFSLIFAALAYNAVLYFRYQPTTWFEASEFFVFCAIVLLIVCTSGSCRGALRVLYLLAIVGLIAVEFPGYINILGDYPKYLLSLSGDQRAAEKALYGFDDSIAFLLPDNSYRPLTVDSDVWKGGSNILEGAKFGASPLVRKMFPRRQYFSEPEAWYAAHPLNLSRFGAVVFTVRVGMDPGATDQLLFMERRFHVIDSDLVNCADIDFGSQHFLVWRHKGNHYSNSPQKFSFTAKRTALRVIELSWNPLNDGATCEIKMKTGKQIDSPFVDIGHCSDESGQYMIGDVSPDSNYYFQIQRVVGDVRSLPSDPVSVPSVNK